LKDEEIYEGWNWKKYLISLIILNKKNKLRPNLKENNLRGWFDFLEGQHKNQVGKMRKQKKHPHAPNRSQLCNTHHFIGIY
jgi:hypothetical protein